MEEKKDVCTTLPDSEKCYDTQTPVADYGKSYKEQLKETKGPSQEEFSNVLYGDKTQADYKHEHIEENPLDKAGDVNTYQAGFARNQQATDYINKKANQQGYTDIPEDEEIDQYNKGRL